MVNLLYLTHYMYNMTYTSNRIGRQSKSQTLYNLQDYGCMSLERNAIFSNKKNEHEIIVYFLLYHGTLVYLVQWLWGQEGRGEAEGGVGHSVAHQAEGGFGDDGGEGEEAGDIRFEQAREV